MKKKNEKLNHKSKVETNQRFKTDPEINNLFSELTTWEKSQLKEDIRKNGIREPLIVTKDMIIVCGHMRYECAKEVGKSDDEIPYKIENFANRQQIIDRAIKDNLLRRNMNKFQKGMVALRLLPLYEKQAKERQLVGTSVKDFTKGRSLEKIAEIVGVSHTTLDKIRTILDNGIVEEIQNAIADEISISALYDKISLRKMVSDGVENPALQKKIINSGLPKKDIGILVGLVKKAKIPDTIIERILKTHESSKGLDMKKVEEHTLNLLDPEFKVADRKEEIRNLEDALDPELRQLGGVDIDKIDRTIILTIKAEDYPFLMEILNSIDTNQSIAVMELARFYQNRINEKN